MKSFLLYGFLLARLGGGAQSLIHLDYKPAGMIIMFPFHDSKIYTDTAAMSFFCDSLQDKGYEKYYSRVKNLILTHGMKAVNDTLTFYDDPVPFEDTLSNLYPANWYINLTIFKLINSGKVKITDKSGNIVDVLRIKRVNKKNVSYITTVYTNAATKNELFRETLFAGPLNLAK